MPFLCRQPLLLFVSQSAPLVLCLCMWGKNILVPVSSHPCVWRLTSLSESVHVQVYSSAFVPQNLKSTPALCRVPASFLAPQCFNQFLTSDLYVHLRVSLPSLSPLCPSVSSSCLGASSSTPPLFQGTVAGPAPAAAGICPSGNTGAAREAFTLYSYHSVHSALSRLNSIQTVLENRWLY